MTTRKILLVSRNKDVFHVAISRRQLNQLIKDKQVRAFVKGEDGKAVEVKVGRYGAKAVRTVADATAANNIKKLPKCKLG